jgi:hypothetical protein
LVVPAALVVAKRQPITAWSLTFCPDGPTLANFQPVCDVTPVWSPHQ